MANGKCVLIERYPFKFCSCHRMVVVVSLRSEIDKENAKIKLKKKKDRKRRKESKKGGEKLSSPSNRRECLSLSGCVREKSFINL